MSGFLPPSALRKSPAEQAKAQAKHAVTAGSILPDQTYKGTRLTLHFRSHPKGGRAVFVSNSGPGEATGHKCFVFELQIADGKEQLGQCIAMVNSVELGINIASKE